MPFLPSATDVHIDAALSNVAIRYKNNSLVAEEMMPFVPVTKQSDKFFKWGREDFVVVKDARRPGAPANEVFDTLSNDTYFCDWHSLKKLVPDAVKENADDALKPEITATERLTNRIKLNYEVRVKDILTDATVITQTADASPNWDASNATIKKDIQTGINTMVQNAGVIPNKILIPRQVATAMSRDSSLLDEIKHTTARLLEVQEGIFLPAYLWGMKVVLADAVQNTANMGQTASNSFIWGENVILAYVSNSPALDSVSGGYTFQWKALRTKKWYDQDREGTWIECGQYVDEKVTAADCYYLITDTLT